MAEYTATGAHAPAVAEPRSEIASNPNLAAALALAGAGLNVSPLTPNAKDPPLIHNWPNEATNDARQIEAWWREWPDANIGVCTSGMLVVDVDPAKGGRESFTALLAEMDLLGEPLPSTWASRTRSGGAHLFFSLPRGVTVANSVEHICKGVDIRGEGGYVVAPGSIVGDGCYEWKDAYSPDNRPIAEAPQWLIDLCKKPAAKNAASGVRVVEEDDIALARADEYLRRFAPEAVQGGRDDTAYKLAARLYDEGISKEACLERLLRWNETNCHPPLELHEMERLAWSAQKNRANAIGAKHPEAPGFDAAEIAPRTTPGANTADSTAQNRPRFYSMSFADAAAQALDQIGLPLIDGVLDCGAMSILYGDTNTGKTFVMLDMAWHIAAGREWAGRHVKRGAVVYVAAEGGRGFLKRLRALQTRYPEADDVPLYVVPCAVDLLNRNAHLGRLISEIKTIAAKASMPVELVVIDTLSRAIAGGNENGPEDMGAFVGNIDALREATKAHVAIVHHTGKDKIKGARGHSSLRAATDTEIGIDCKLLTITKQRDGETGWSVGFALRPHRLGVSAAGNEVISCTVDIRPDARPEPIALQPALQDFLDEIENELLERCQDDIAAVSRTPFSTALAIKCAARLPSADARTHPPGSKAMRDHVNRMMREMRDKGHVRKVQRGQWFLVDARDAHDAQNQSSPQCADARGALAPRIAEDQPNPTSTGRNPSNLGRAAPAQRARTANRAGA